MGNTDGAGVSGQGNTSTHLAVSKTIKQVVRVCADDKKVANLVELLKSILRRPDEIDKRQPSAVLVFCTRIKTVRRVHKHLEDLGVRSGQLHGQLAQPLREKALADFKAGAVRCCLRSYTCACTA